MIAAKRGFILGTMPLLALLAGGCGTNFDEILYQAFAATGRTALDIFLTDLANDLADRADGGDAAPDDTDGDGGTGDGGTGDGGDSDGGDAADGASVGGDAAAGETIYVSNGCGSCHCADAGGGCALDAPALHDADGETLDEFLRGDTPHQGGKHDLTDQDIHDLQAFLGGLG